MTRVVTPEVQRAFRLACGSLLAVRVVLISRYLAAAAWQIAAPVQDHFFPAPLRDPALLVVAFVAPMLTASMALARPTPERMKGAAVVELLGTAVLLLHQATYFYATWVIGFWVAVYLMWLAWRAGSDARLAAMAGPFLAQLLIAFFFLGGAVGKWTAGYWSGDVFYQVFLQHQMYAGYLQTHLGLERSTVQDLAQWLSRFVVVSETALAGLIFLPAQTAAVLGIAAAIGLWCANPSLFEVAWPLIGLALAGRALAPRRGPHTHPAVTAGQSDGRQSESGRDVVG